MTPSPGSRLCYCNTILYSMDCLLITPLRLITLVRHVLHQLTPHHTMLHILQCSISMLYWFWFTPVRHVLHHITPCYTPCNVLISTVTCVTPTNTMLHTLQCAPCGHLYASQSSTYSDWRQFSLGTRDDHQQPSTPIQYSKWTNEQTSPKMDLWRQKNNYQWKGVGLWPGRPGLYYTAVS